MHRSQNTPSGFFSQMGGVHLHIDGGRKIEIIKQLLVNLEKRFGVKTKINHISRSIFGPQKEKLPELYSLHNPGTDTEDFDFFSTIEIPNIEQGKAIINFVMLRLKDQKNIVFEIEGVLGKIGETRLEGWEYDFNSERAALKSFGPPSLETLAVEIHHKVDFQYKIDFESFVEEVPIEFGGWFLFQNKNLFSCRSNFFCDREKGLGIAVAQNRKLENFLLKKFKNYKLETLVERVLKIWKI